MYLWLGGSQWELVDESNTCFACTYFPVDVSLNCLSMSVTLHLAQCETSNPIQNIGVQPNPYCFLMRQSMYPIPLPSVQVLLKSIMSHYKATYIALYLHVKSEHHTTQKRAVVTTHIQCVRTVCDLSLDRETEHLKRPSCKMDKAATSAEATRAACGANQCSHTTILAISHKQDYLLHTI